MRRARQICFTSEDDLFNNNKQNNFNIINNFDLIKILNSMCDDHKNIIFNNSLIPSFLTNNAGKIIYVNEAWEDICKYKPHDILGLNFNFLHGTKTNIEECKSFLKHLFKNDYAKMNIINYDKNNNELYVNVEAYKIKYKKGSSIDKNYYDNELKPYFIGTLKEIF